MVWLSGVRRVGKTALTQQLPARYFDCELPSIRKEVEGEAFLKECGKGLIVLDEIHRLQNPTQILKIAADHYPQVKIVATGSSTLEASKKFRDTLTGRKYSVWLTPMNSLDGVYFGIRDIQTRLRLGGLPPFILSGAFDEPAYQEWIDSFWAKDIQELFRVERRYSFIKFVELLMQQSGGIFEATRFSGPCEVSHTTITNYLSVLEATHLAHIIRPYSTRRSGEIIASPKVYGFDTGFITLFKGWGELRNEDYGLLWEHYVLNELHSLLEPREIHYWRDKAGHEMDWVIKIRGKDPIAIECKWKEESWGWSSLLSFRHRHPQGENYLISADNNQARTIEKEGILLHKINIQGLREIFQKNDDV
ncbi:MAG: ATP-binding protein [Deltaproteobacteria bacterium]|nr:ATP-binding protein [Deltaproteobacteria bacterium]